MKLLLRLSFLIILFSSLIAISACQKEEPLAPNPDAAGAQAFDFNFPDTSGTGGGGGGTTVNQYFNATIDGQAISYGNYNYVSNGASVILSGFSATSPNAITFSIVGSLSTGDVYDLSDAFSSASYTRGVGDAVSSTSGSLTIDEVSSDLVRGTFFFTAKAANNPSDSVVVTNGSFQIGI